MRQQNCGYAPSAFRVQKPPTRPAKKRMRDTETSWEHCASLMEYSSRKYWSPAQGRVDARIDTLLQPRVDALDGCTYTLWPRVSRYKNSREGYQRSGASVRSSQQMASIRLYFPLSLQQESCKRIAVFIVIVSVHLTKYFPCSSLPHEQAMHGIARGAHWSLLLTRSPLAIIAAISCWQFHGSS